MKSHSFTTSLFMMLIICAAMYATYYFLYSLKDIGFLAGLVTGIILWQLNYKNHTGNWFDY